MNRIYALALLSILIAGCATVAPLNEQSSTQLHNKTLAQSRYPKGHFNAMTFEIAARGAFASADGITAGNAIVQKYEIEDPALSVSEKLGENLQKKFGMSRTAPTGLSVSDDLDQLTKQYEQSELLLDVRTTVWSFGYFPLNWNHYRIIYGVRARLIDVKTKAILAEGTCFRAPKNDEEAPSYEELMRNKATRLKQELQSAGLYCAEMLSVEIFKV